MFEENVYMVSLGWNWVDDIILKIQYIILNVWNIEWHIKIGIKYAIYEGLLYRIT